MSDVVGPQNDPTVAEADSRWMRRALAHACRGLGRTTPNPVVGACVVTADGVVVGDGAHERAGGPHAEIFAIEAAGARAGGGTLYSTLEPCSHIGRTGPCTDRIIAAGIRRGVAAMEDPYPLVSGRGFAILRDHGIAVTVGVGREEAVRLNQPFLTAVRERRPFVILKAATSLDSRMAAAAGERTQLTSAAADRHAHYVRAQVDAIAIGSGTLLVDDPLLTARHVYRERPLTRVIFDRRLRTPPDARIFSTLPAGPVIIVTSRHAQSAQRDRSDALERAGATVLALDEPTMTAALPALAGLDVQSLVLEGGPGVHRAAWDAGVVDYVQLYIAPVAVCGSHGGVAGTDAPSVVLGPESMLASLVEQRVRMLGPDVLIEGYVHRPH
ncbi:MAG: bifunctional diaminohydroxyphosphoribosylaminopyrimidine deaminase/5-amino-6-(5-phosphoribosylamino)uracil reductase RibD [Acidobacteria bacterium]|nr:bifunctional diaminohydroxyphosphoribosylaminopyrimidine deaminase/5-amino-6-(5-phosphoribosylamino)uracil reductase RibD [Acidobacteriota bacterium]